MYEVLLGDIGGHHHSQADRVAVEKALATAPEAATAARENRRFVQRAVRYLAGRGIRQYIDMGSGFPAKGQVHEIASEIVGDPHVVTSTTIRWSHARARRCSRPAATSL